jgi:hypothetical protein
MDNDRFDRLQALSRELCGNKLLLPVAAAILEVDERPLSAPLLMKALGGRAAPNRISECLQTLDRLGVLKQLPYPGRPHPRLFEQITGPFWDFISKWALDQTVKPESAT